MKKLLLLAFTVSLIFVNVHALGKLQVKSIIELAPTHTSMVVRDADGKYAPALIVKTELKGLGFKNIGRPTPHAAQYDEGLHQYKFYLNDKQRVMQITHSEYEPLEVRLLADWNIEVKAQRVYEMVLENRPENEVIPFNIITNPNDATKFIDDKSLGTGESFELEVGEHNLRVEKEGYEPHSETIIVSKTKPYINITLAEAEPVMITIKSTPTEADINLDSLKKGKTDKAVFVFPGEYTLRLSKDKYDILERKITVTKTGSNLFDFSLTKNTSILTIDSTPSNCEVYINNEKVTGNKLELPPGMYRIEVKKDGYIEQSKTLTLEKGKDTTESFSLEQKAGKLQFEGEPLSARTTMKSGSSVYKSWSGSKYLSDVPIGSYELTTELNGYQKQTKTISIKQNET
ncbi:MAG: PEGA domain-containing protein, partial [Candidatus Zophobacter franzmannii]|nr:PEGA domain-containing protein [Candidatus Zophobacter franzmannii]